MQKAADEYRKDVSEGKEAEAEMAQQAMDEAHAKAQLYQDQIDRGVIRAPFDGIILSGDLTQERNATKKQGEELFTIAAMPSASGLRAELAVSERDVQDLKEGFHGELATTALPTEKFAFTINRIEPLGEAKDGDNTFTVYGHLDKTSPTWRPGMAGEARVAIERRPLVWIWTHKFIDYVRFKLWM